MRLRSGLIVLAVFALAACGGGGGGGTTTIPSTPTPAPSMAAVTSQSQSISTSTTTVQSSSYAITGLTATASIPSGNIVTTLSTVFQTSQPAGTPTIQNLQRRPQAIGASAIGAVAFYCVTPAATVTLSAFPSFVVTVPGNSVASGSVGYVAFFDPANSAAAWSVIEGPAALTNSSFTFSGTSPGPTLQAGQTYCLLFFTLASALATPSPTPSPSSTTTLPLTVTKAIAISPLAQASATFAIQGYTSLVTVPTANGSASLSATFSTTLPANTPAVQNVKRRPENLGVTPINAGAYLCVTSSADITLSQYPSFQFTTQSLTGSTANAYVAMYSPFTADWTQVEGPPTLSGTTLTFTASTAGPTFLSGLPYCFAVLTVNAPLPTPTPLATPSPIATTIAGVPAWTATQRTGYMAVAYGGNAPFTVGIYAPGQTVASTTLTYATCCLWQIQFQPDGTLLVATSNDGILSAAPGATSLSPAFPAQGGFSMVNDALGDVAVGGYNFGSTISVYPAGVAANVYHLPGQPAFQGLAFSPTGEIAVPQSDGTIKTYLRGSTTANRTLPVSLETQNSINSATIAYDSNGNLAVGSFTTTTLAVYAPTATTPAYTIAGLGETQSVAFDSHNRLFIGDTASVKIYAAGTTTLQATITNTRPVALAVGIHGEVGVAGWTNPSQYYSSSGVPTGISGLFQAEGVAISP